MPRRTWFTQLAIARTAPRLTLFPYTTLFRSPTTTTRARFPSPRATSSTERRTFRDFRVCGGSARDRSEEHTSELQSLRHLVCRLLLEKRKGSAPSPTCHGRASSTDRLDEEYT